MITLSIQQPWASLLAEQLKTIEVRGWPTNYRGQLLVRASKNSTAKWFDDDNKRIKLPTQCHLFVCELVSVRPMRPEDRLRAMSFYWGGEYSWTIRIICYVFPTPAVGKLRLYYTDDDLIVPMPDNEIRKYHPELTLRSRHPFRAKVVRRELIVTDSLSGEIPFCTLHSSMTPLVSYVFVPMYGLIGGAQGGDTSITWEEVASVINQGRCFQSVEDLPVRPVKANRGKP